MNEGSYSTADGIVIGSRVKLLGILYAGPIYNAQGEVKVVPIPQATKVVAITGMPNNLGYVIKSSELKSIEEKLRAPAADEDKKN